MTLNEAKLLKYNRPFQSKVSLALDQCVVLFDEFEEKITSKKYSLNTKKEIIKDVEKVNSEYSNIIKKIKNICQLADVEYAQISNFIIGVIFNRIRKTHQFNWENIEENKYIYLISLLQTSMFFAMVTKDPTSSFKILSMYCYGIRYLNSNELLLDAFKNKLFIELKKDFLELCKHNTEEFEIIKVNYLLSLSLFKNNHVHSLKEDEIMRTFNKNNNNNNFSYFETIGILYYIENDSSYSKLRNKIQDNIKATFQSIKKEDLTTNTYLLMQLLDYIACPYLDKKDKNILTNLIQKNISKREKESLFKQNWFTDWPQSKQNNLIKNLIKQEIILQIQVY
ncbi:hypothetical protein GKC56_00140 [Neisseriaceae bacterium PsAf]|nr:hypothetical protein [Neisseriaceae bacterium PsAf]